MKIHFPYHSARYYVETIFFEALVHFDADEFVRFKTLLSLNYNGICNLKNMPVKFFSMFDTDTNNFKYNIRPFNSVAFRGLIYSDRYNNYNEPHKYVPIYGDTLIKDCPTEYKLVFLRTMGV